MVSVVIVLFPLQVGRGSEKKIVGLNVVLDSDELQNFSGFLSRYLFTLNYYFKYKLRKEMSK